MLKSYKASHAVYPCKDENRVAHARDESSGLMEFRLGFKAPVLGLCTGLPIGKT